MERFLRSLFIVLIVAAGISFAAAVALGQSTTQISRKCPGVSPSPARAELEIEKDGDVTINACSGKSIAISVPTGGLDLLDANYTGAYFTPQTNYFSIGTTTRQTIPAANHLVADDVHLPLTVSGTNKTYIGRKTTIDAIGTTTNPTIYGNWTNIATNGLVTGTGTIYGNYSTVDIGTQVTEAYGGFFSAFSGGSGASGAGTIYGVRAVSGMSHNGTLGTAIAVDAWLSSSSSTPSTTTLATAVRARATLQSGVTATTVRGVSISDYFMNGGTIENSVGLYIDTSVDAGTVSKYAILSTATSPSRFSGRVQVDTNDVYVSDNTKGMILKSPDGTCYRYTAANGGALNAGVSVTCP